MVHFNRWLRQASGITCGRATGFLVRLIIVVLLLRSLASVFAKQAAITSVGLGLYGIVVNVWLLAELLALGAQALIWVMVIRRVALSHAYPVMSLVFGLNLFAAWLIFNEPVLPQHIIGVLVIIGGVVLLSPELE